MQVVPEVVTRVGFGLFEADLRTGELWKAGRRIKLQSQPFKVLTCLLETPGDIVTREELQIRLWGPAAVGDFDHSLGTAINKIREALGDTADNPRFVETLARRGYRWIAPVTILGTRQDANEASPRAPSPASPVAGSSSAHEDTASISLLEADRPPDPRPVARPDVAPQPAAVTLARATLAGWPIAAAAILVALLLALAACWYGRSARPAALLLHMDQVTHSGTIAPGVGGFENLPAAVTDGLRVYVPVLAEGQSVLSAVDSHTGAAQPVNVPSAIQSPSLGDISPDGSTLLLRSHLSPESELPFWTVPAGGGSALRLANVVGHDATWMPDGKSILYASGNALFTHRLDEGTFAPFATLPARAFWLRWSPDGTLLRFTLLDPVDHTMQLAEIRRDGSGFRTLLEGWNKPASECCGVWTGNGRTFVFQATRAGDHDPGTDLWRLEGKHVSAATRVTDGPINYVAPVASRIGQRIYFLGLEARSALRQFDPVRHQYTQAPAFLANATRVQYTRDSQWVTWTDLNGHQWRAHADGSDVLQLTPDSMQVFLGTWSPDGRRVALMARPLGKAWGIYLVAAEGGSPELALKETRNAADPSWAPDGQQLVFGRVSDVMGKEEGPRALEILDLATSRTTVVPNSEGLFSPRWSPDGRYIAALSLDQRKLVLFDTTAKTWRTLAETTAADPVWAPDSQSLFFHASLAPNQPIYRVNVRDNTREMVADALSYGNDATTDSFFCGLTRTGAPIVRTRTATANLYTIDLDHN